jgi:hypothetical protein
MTKNTIRLALAVATLVAGAPYAHAGKAIDHQVDINQSTQTASGALNAARHSPDGSQWIGCTVRVGAPSTPAELNCKAVDKSERQLFCSTTDPVLVQVALGIADYSWILFKCDEKDLVALNVSKYSYSLP